MRRWMVLGVLGISLGSFCSAASYGGGDGTPVNPYRILTPEHLIAMSLHMEDMDKAFILMADLNMSAYPGTSYNPIFFSGRFNGNHRTIRNLSFTVAYDRNYVGLFASATNAFITDLHLENVSIHTPGNYAGGLVGSCMSSDIYDCTISGSVSGNLLVGGLVGENYGSTIASCRSECEVAGNEVVGGLVGAVLEGGTVRDSQAVGPVSGNMAVGGLVGAGSGSILRCFATGTVTGTGHSIGGLAGGSDGSVTSCHATGTVNGNLFTGGLIGYNQGSLTDSYASGPVTAGAGTGGLVGLNEADISRCFAVGSVHGSSSVGGLAGSHDTGFLVSDCYASGAVEGEIFIGGLIGSCTGSMEHCCCRGPVSGTDCSGGMVGSSNATAAGCFWDTATSQKTNAVGSGQASGMLGRTTQQMKTVTTFTSAGWDFMDIWRICEGTNYPRLKWQIPTADRICPDGVAMEDLAHFAARWMRTNCPLPGACSGADLDQSSAVDLADLIILSDQWLQR